MAAPPSFATVAPVPAPIGQCRIIERRVGMPRRSHRLQSCGVEMPTARSNTTAAGTIGTGPTRDWKSSFVFREPAHDAVGGRQSEGAAAGQHDRVYPADLPAGL